MYHEDLILLLKVKWY